MWLKLIILKLFSHDSNFRVINVFKVEQKENSKIYFSTFIKDVAHTCQTPCHSFFTIQYFVVFTYWYFRICWSIVFISITTTSSYQTHQSTIFQPIPNIVPQSNASISWSFLFVCCPSPLKQCYVFQDNSNRCKWIFIHEVIARVI